MNLTPADSKSTLTEQAPKEYSLYPRMVAEFEPQRAIVLSVSDLQPHHSHVLTQIVKESAGHADILILYNTDQQLKQTVEIFDEKNVPIDHVSFYKLRLDTVWLRDFGPRIAEDENGIRSIDFYYHGVRPFDDSFPERWACKTKGKLTKVPWTLQGGNLISNGQGIGIASSRIFTDNSVSFTSTTGYRASTNEGRAFITKEIKKLCNLKDLVILEPLRNESTKHVDMFAAFLAPDHVLVASVDPRSDSVNSRILDWNAKKLSELTVDGKRMRVDRIQIPPRDGKAWSTYTNAIFTDRLVLMPTMSSDSKAIVDKAYAKYQRLLPNHHIAKIDITSMKKLQGSLHCMSLNLPAFAELPEGVISFAKAEQIAARTREKVDKKKKDNPHAIENQLRKVFQSASGEHLVDAFAVGIDRDTITLIRTNDYKLLRIRISSICQTDIYWVERNRKKIREKGAYVKSYVNSNRGRIE